MPKFTFNQENTHPPTPTRHKLIGIGILLIIAFSIYTYIDTLVFSLTAERTTGRIVSIDKKWQCHRNHETNRDVCSWVYHPIFTFRDYNNNWQKIRSSVSTQKDSYKSGQTINVLYNRQRVDEANINSFGDLWFKAFFFSLWGLIVGIGYLIWSKKAGNYPALHPAWQVNIVKASLLLPAVVVITSMLV